MSGRDRFETWTATPVRIGELVALADGGATALVIDPAHPELPAREARTVVDLHAAHIGAEVVVLCDSGDATRPIVMGVLRGGTQRPEALPVEADGERLIVSAEHQLILRCGKASITLTSAGKILVQGTYVSSNSTGVHRIRGASLALN
jgi:hypothetical protein